MMTDDGDFNRVKQFAALSGAFSPATALRSAGLQNLVPAAVSEIASRLSELCDIIRSDGTETWLLKRNERQWILNSLDKSDELTDAMDRRRSQAEFNQEAEDLEGALSGVQDFALGTLEALAHRLEGLSRLSAADLEPVERITTTLERLGKLAPGFKLVPRFYGLLNREADETRRDTILTDRFQGRGDQIDDIVDWINAANPMSGPTQCLLVRGLPGIGKSALLEAACQRLRSQGLNLIVVRFDFDRPVLDVLDPVGLTLELARQVAIQIPERAGDLKARRMTIASEQRIKGSRDSRFEQQETQLSDLLQGAFEGASATLLLVVDTLEALRGRGPSHPYQLFEWIDRLARSISTNIRVIAAGRGEPLQEIPNRIGMDADLSGLLDGEVDQILARSDISPDLWPAIRVQADGNPMMVRIIAEMAKEDPSSLRDDAGTSARAFLNRWLFARIHDPNVRRMAEHGLFLREISADAIATLWPKLANAPAPTRADSDQAYQELAEMTWLLNRTSDGQGLRMRPEFRRLLLPKYYVAFKRSAPGSDRMAAAWFGRRTTAESEVDALYHGLQALRGRGAPPVIKAETAYRLDEDTISELPVRAQDMLRLARHERSESSRSAASGTDGFAIDLNLMMEKGDWGEAFDVYRKIGNKDELNPTGDVGRAARTFEWKTGRWASALRSLRRQDNLIGPDIDWNRLPPIEALAHMEMRAEFGLRSFAMRMNTDSEFQSRVTETVFRSLKSDVAFGGLGLALNFTSGNTPRGRLLDINLCWEHPESPNAPPIAWERIQQVLPGAFIDPNHPAAAARACAALTPYNEPLKDMPGEQSDEAAIPKLRGLIDNLRRFPLPVNGGMTSLDARSVERLNPLSILCDAGLLAEALGVIALHGDPDIKLIARRAEYWRKLAAGRRPADPRSANFRLKGWRWDLDATLWHRIKELERDTDPIGASRGCLEAWLSVDKTMPPRELLRSEHLTKKTDRVRANLQRKGDDVYAAARYLSSSRMPTALIPPLAILLWANVDF
ncbi:ATP-binding protein [Rhizobium ruizarguesonis]|uniref:ATP-binding protein n=1 Tax=Rhizobium ruizarguesonis TaxID=2081791 RepID=UPI00103059E5|nr:ATP-binding protein [Rhizobium ruizarguesonis]TAX63544.1 ATP-binding protein [Rhizobium ruizarguesonis]